MNRQLRLYRQHMAKYKPLMQDAMRNMTTIVQKRLLGNIAAIAFHAGYEAGFKAGAANEPPEQLKLKPWRPNGKS